MPPGSRYKKHWVRREDTRWSEPSGYGIRTTCSVCWITVRLPQTLSLFLNPNSPPLTDLRWYTGTYSHLLLTTLLHHNFVSVSQRRKLVSETLGNSPQLTWLAGEGQDVKGHAHVTETLCCPNCSRSQTSKMNCISPKMWVSALGPLLFFSLSLCQLIASK